MVNVVPDLLLGEIKKAGQHDEKYERLEAEPLALVELGLRRPHQEGGDVLGVLIDSRRCAVGIFDLSVAQRLRHRDGMAGKVLVVLRARRQRDPGRRIFVADEDGVDVVGAVLLVLGESIEDEPGKARFEAARLRQHGHVGRQAAPHRRAGSLIVRERRREVIGELAGALEHFALVVRPIGHLKAGGDSRRLGLSKAWPARLLMI